MQELVEQAERLVQTEPQEPALMEQPEPEQTAAMAVQHPVQLAQLIIPEIPAHLETQEILPMQTALPEIVETAAQELAEPLLQTEADSTANNNGQSQTSNAVKTGDETTVLPFVLLLMTAAGMVAAVFGIRRKENE